MLGNRVFVWIGLISYSAYLWHQPIFAFARIKIASEPSHLLMSVLAISSLALAYCSWKFIETPFRNKTQIGRAKIFLFSFFGLILFVVFGLSGHKLNGFENRLENYQLEIIQWEQYSANIAYRERDCLLHTEQSYREFKSECTDDKAETLIWGDSHAAALSSGFRLHTLVHQLTASGCPPILYTNFPSRPNCSKINKHIIDVISKEKYKTVILHAYWAWYIDERLQNLSLTINELLNIGVQNIVIIGGIPEYLPSLPRRLLLERKPLNDITFIDENQSNIASYDKKLLELISGLEVNFFNALDVFCNVNSCKVTTDFQGKVVPMAWDYGHLTEGGAYWFAKQIDNFLSK